MKHLSPDVLARLVDEPPSEGERHHLETCRRCGDELHAFEAQRRAFSGLGGIQPPARAWEALEARLRDERLIEPPAARDGSDCVVAVPRAPGSAPWLRAAAAVLLFVGGALVGAAVRGGSDAAMVPTGTLAFPEELGTAAELSLDEMEELVTLAHQWHLDALLLYQDRLEQAGQAVPMADPVTRFVAIEQLLSATEAAVRENPADPFLNGVLVGAAAERQAALEGIASTFREP